MGERCTLRFPCVVQQASRSGEVRGAPGPARSRSSRGCRTARRAAGAHFRYRNARALPGAERCLPSTKAGSRADSSASSSTGRTRASSADNASCPATSRHVKDPVLRSSTASPNRSRCECTAISSDSRSRSSSASSVTVPGVTIRVTSRWTGPRVVAGSPICSQIAAPSPRRMRRAR